MEAKEQNIDYNQIWLLFKETDRQFKETDRQFKETALRFQETDRQFREMRMEFKEIQASMERDSRLTEKKLRKLETLFTGQWGKLVESLVRGKLVKLLKEKNIDVRETYTNVESDTEDMEIDIIVANGTDVVAVEVKTNLKKDEVDEFIEKLMKFKRVFKRFSKECLYGAVAFLKDESSASKYAEKKGLFVIRATGDSASIVNKQGFQPQEW